MRKTLISIALCVAVVTIGVTLSGRLAALKRAGSGQAGAEPMVHEKLTNVAVRVLRSHSVEDILRLTGFVQAWEDVTISAETRGKIEWQGVEAGDRVKGGQELFKVNTTVIQANMDQARAEFTSAERELERIEKLGARGISSPQEFDKAIMGRDSTRARLRLTEIQRDQSVVTAPFDGIVDSIEREAGEFVDVGVELLRLVQIDRVKIIVGLPELEIANFADDDEVVLSLDAFPNRRFEGSVFHIATSAEFSTRTFRTEIAVDNSDGWIRPGMVARIRFVRKVYPDAITIPLFSVLSRDGKQSVIVEDEGVAHERTITVGFMQGDLVHVSSGLSDGDRLIVSGHRELREGQKVKVQRVEDGS